MEVVREERGRTEQREHSDRQSILIESESERQVHSRTTAGVSKDRREAKKR